MGPLNRAAFLLILMIVVAITMLYGGVHQPVLAVFYVSAALLAVLWAADSSRRGELRFAPSLLYLPLLILGVYAVVQVVPFGMTSDPAGVAGIPRTISADPFATSLAAVQLFSLLIFFAGMLIYIDSAKRLSRLAGFLTIFGFAYAFFAILQSVLSPEAIYGIYKPAVRPFGTFVNRNDYAAMIVMLMSVPLGMLFSGAVAREKRLLYAIAIALMATSLLLSQSRGGLVAFVAEVILLALLTRTGKSSKNLLLKFALAILFLLTAIGGAIFVGGETSLTRFSGNDIAVEAPAETTSRFHIWTTTAKMIADNMPLGVGLGAFPAVYPQYDTGSGYERVNQAHNDYLQLVSDAGVVGAALGILFLYLLIRQGRESVRVDNGLRRGIAVGALAGIVAVLVHSAFDFVLHITAVSLMFLLLLAMLVASSRKYDDDIMDFDETRHHRHRRSSRSPRRDSAEIAT
jgi:O-antigen ligase